MLGIRRAKGAAAAFAVIAVAFAAIGAAPGSSKTLYGVSVTTSSGSSQMSGATTQRYSLVLRPSQGWIAHWLTLRAGVAVRFEVTYRSAKADVMTALVADARQASRWPDAAAVCIGKPCARTAKAATRGTADPLFDYLDPDVPPPLGPRVVALQYVGGPDDPAGGSVDVYGEVTDQQFWLSNDLAGRAKGGWFTFIAPTTGRYAIVLNYSGHHRTTAPLTASVRFQIHRYRLPGGAFANSDSNVAFPFQSGTWHGVCSAQVPWMFSAGFFSDSGSLISGSEPGVVIPGDPPLTNLKRLGLSLCTNYHD